VGDKVVRCCEKVVYNNLVLIVLEFAVSLHLETVRRLQSRIDTWYLLYPDTMMRDFPQIAKAFPLFFCVRVLVKQISLAHSQLRKHEHAGARIVDIRLLDEKFICRPCVVDPDSRSPIAIQSP
jgi:hypothetical protein